MLIFHGCNCRNQKEINTAKSQLQKNGPRDCHCGSNMASSKLTALDTQYHTLILWMTPPDLKPLLPLFHFFKLLVRVSERLYMSRPKLRHQKRICFCSELLVRKKEILLLIRAPQLYKQKQTLGTNLWLNEPYNGLRQWHPTPVF